jgi:hypothetical protein
LKPYSSLIFIGLFLEIQKVKKILNDASGPKKSVHSRKLDDASGPKKSVHSRIRVKKGQGHQY